MSSGISIITVVFNGQATVEATIKSVVDNSKKIDEFIVIDGGSRDHTIDILKKYQEYITYWTSGPDEGIYDAMNKGWDRAKIGNYILFLGAGDKIVELPSLDQYSGIDVVFGNVFIGDKLFSGHLDFRLTLGNTLHHQALLIRKREKDISPFSTTYQVYGDFDFNQRLYKEKRKFVKSNRFVSYALEGGISASRDNKEMLKVVGKNYGFLTVQLAKLYYLMQNVRKNR